MAANVIASRIADFLKKYPPFTHLSKEELVRLAEAAIVCHFEAGEYVFKQGEEKHGYLYVLKEGSVHLEREEGRASILVDTCDEGDIFGVRAMLTGKPYVFHAHCVEECLAYGVPIGLFQPLLESNTEIALFFASGLAAGQTGLLQAYSKQAPVYQDSGSMINWNHRLEKIHRPLIWAYPHQSIQEVAKVMTENKIGSMVMCNTAGKAVGIVTDTDFRAKIGTGKAKIEDPVASIMSGEVLSMSLGLPLSAYLLEMLRNKIRHLCIVSDGRPIGILSERDLIAAHQNHPVALLYAIEEAESLENLKGLRDQADQLIRFYLEQQVSIGLTSSLATHINDAVITKVINIATKSHGEAPKPFAFLCLGSEGRSEQLIRTDQDNCLVYADVTGTKEEVLSVQKYFFSLAFEVNCMLEELGFQRCPADMMAGNPQWCQPLSQWKDYFSNWIREPEEKALLFSSIFFDFRKVYGDDEIVSELKQHLEYEIKEEKIFLNFLAKNALKNPAPLSFFRNFVVERSGEHQDKFDIKGRAMMPFADIARVLSLDVGQLDEMNTVARYRKLAEIEPKRSELYRAAADSYEYLMRIRALKGFENNNTGRFIPIDGLGKLERQILRNTFDPINQLQKALELRYQLSYFR